MNLSGVLFLGGGISESNCNTENLINAGVDGSVIEGFVVSNFPSDHFQYHNENNAIFTNIADYFEAKI